MAEHVIRYSHLDFGIRNFSVGGSDERQYCSPGFDLPVGSIMRTPYQEFKEYHTSLDNKELISFTSLNETIETVFNICKAHEMNEKPFCNIQYCEPQLGKRGLYPASVNPSDSRAAIHRRMHLLSYADGNSRLVEIAEMRNELVLIYKNEIDQLLEGDLIELR